MTQWLIVVRLRASATDEIAYRGEAVSLQESARRVIDTGSVEGRATCFFITGGKGLADFSLVDDGSGTNIQTFSSLLPGTFTITNGLGIRRCPSGE